MGVLARIFGSDKVLSKGLELIDDAWTTDAEMIEVRAKAKIDLMNAYAPFKLAQRYIAIMFTGTFLLSFFLVLGLTLAGKSQVDDVFTVLDQFMIGWIMTAIVSFYFGGGLVDSFKRSGKVK